MNSVVTITKAATPSTAPGNHEPSALCAGGPSVAVQLATVMLAHYSELSTMIVWSAFMRPPRTFIRRKVDLGQVRWVGRERMQVNRSEVLAQMVRVAGAKERHDERLLSQQPRQARLRRMRPTSG